jgi:prepilin-type N-terminal cleavage/methylation domain-containing protein
MSMKQRGFSLTEVLIATAISSLLLISASRFYPDCSGRYYCNLASESWKKRSGNACSPSANSFSVRGTARETARDRRW